jgi:hypothetical protein
MLIWDSCLDIGRDFPTANINKPVNLSPRPGVEFLSKMNILRTILKVNLR